jgi:kynurenine 3-monooxygenase
MRDGIRDPAFERRKSLAFELERLTGGRFTPRYSLVMFHPEVGYAEAERRGRIQADILRRATSGPDDDTELALRLIDEQL